MKAKTRLAFKSIVKECLIELLAEGLVGNNQASIREKRELRGSLQESYENTRSKKVFSESILDESHVSKTSTRTRKTPSYLDSIVAGVDNIEINRENAITSKIKNITNDDVMADILADTAKTTLLEQSQKLSQPSASQSGDTAAKIAANSDPTELFADSAGRWANLAFAESK